MRSLPFIFAALVCLSPVSQSVEAQSAVLLYAQADHVAGSSAEAARLAQARYGGKVLKVKRDKDGRRYKVRLLLDDGRVKDVVIKGD
ncbi:PepSY domain-containing protein [Simiduia aestuariiviva]|uniref:Putative membrane protein YkoI n=1 Tax=Simiduia aestuariiviva TaxID=1510459 RepID=A0A839ULD8_9GAMM|nr:hypothetical protein [Simiduia aestuariiviva]MBB3168662.1 putative membrane protein YkoI [Simiduia aestuariiviva]